MYEATTDPPASTSMTRPTMRGRWERRSGSRRWRQATNHSKPRAVALRRTGCPEAGVTSLRPHQWEEDDVADGGLVGEQHGQAVHPDALAGGGGHAQLQGPAVVLVVVHGLLGPAGLGVDLALEAGPLV